MTIESDFGSIEEHSTPDTALAVLQRFSKTAWVRDELFDAVVRFSLPSYAKLPPDAVVGIWSVEVNGSRKMLPVPEIGPRMALLLTHEIDQLGKNHNIVTNRPALVPGDPDYKSWDEVKAERQARPRKPGERTRYDKWFEPAGISGQWMGQSDKYFFTRTFAVHPNDVRFPRHTIIELIRISLDPLRAHELRRFAPDDSTVRVPAQDEHGASQDVSSDVPEQAGAPEVIFAPIERNKSASNNWDEYALRRLLDESHEAGSTHEKLAAKYGVTRQRIGALLKQTRELFGVKKASAFDFVRQSKRK